MGQIHSFETLGTLDGPGIRTVVFFQGCPMRCKYCHNPDTHQTSGNIEMTAGQVAGYAARYKNYFGDNGGATLSGGEPLLQEEFCFDVINKLKDYNINVVLDTSGCIYSPRCLDASDLVILDIKRNEPKDFFDLCNFNMDNTLKTLQYLKDNKKNFWTRQVIVPGINDRKQDIEKFVNLSDGAKKVQLLGFHTLGNDKYKKLNMQNQFADIAPLDICVLQNLQNYADSLINR